MKGPDGKTCVDKNRGGPAWNFSNPRAADFFVSISTSNHKQSPAIFVWMGGVSSLGLDLLLDPMMLSNLPLLNVPVWMGWASSR